ncbi:serine hydrolase domain-containing protein [Edaphobacter bradus]|uniref:serine hydrolase domain-containing protein n=1 Tax=Edaphobacter bradus TaxID=2259016 RepID=UPI0021DFFC0E|nr:serine hydrolase domain-containing protein [Edaphobacter bradus]
MKTTLLVLVCLLTLPSRAEDPGIRRLDGTKISIADAEALARRTLAENHVTGAQIAVLNRGHLVWSAAFGLRSRDPDLPMQPTTTTWAASITKSVFATYVMQLAQSRQFPLDIPIVHLMPHPLDSYEPYRDTASEIAHDPLFGTVTPVYLLSHTAGFANFSSLEPDHKLHIHFIPGSQFAYSGDGINLLQFVVEQQLANKPLDELMQQSLFTPLHMDHTSLIYKESFAGNIADRFDSDEKFISHPRRAQPRAAGSMTTTANDLATFLTALLSTEKKDQHILTPKALHAMLTPNIAIMTQHQFPTFDETEGAEGPVVGLSYALGWGVLARTRYGPAIFKEGHGDGAQNYLICFVRTRDCMIILTNSDNGELAFRPLLEGILGDTVTPWEWEGYTREAILASRKPH